MSSVSKSQEQVRTQVQAGSGKLQKAPLSHLALHASIVRIERFRLLESKVMFLFRGKKKDPRQPRGKGQEA